MGVVGLVTATSHLPSRDDLVEISGPLRRYESYRRPQGGAVLVIAIEGRPIPVWTDALWPSQAPGVFDDAYRSGHVPEIRVFVPRDSRDITWDEDAEKSYGLWIDGRAVETVEAGLDRDWLIVRVLFPALGLVCLGMALLVRTWTRRKLREREMYSR
jgi:hypothetical protein